MHNKSFGEENYGTENFGELQVICQIHQSFYIAKVFFRMAYRHAGIDCIF